METSAKSGSVDDFVTVVSVGSQVAVPRTSSIPENFVTVLAIGSEEKTAGPHCEEVEVFRLPGERLGFGLKFEGGNKTSEKIRRLFIQSCAEQSPASRAKCSWGILGEGDEVLSIDGVPVTHMTRLDCVRRLKESQLVIKLVVRCRGALRPEVVSAERKSHEPEKNKMPPDLPSAPPPVPPRKLRQMRGSADGEANPSPAKKLWDASKSGSSSLNDSPQSQSSMRSCVSNNSSSGKSTAYESCNSSPQSRCSSKYDSPKGSPKSHSADFCNLKQEPPEAMVYLDARSQDALSTHDSTSDDTGSSMSTVVDRFSTSDRFSTISTISTTSTASEQHNGSDQYDRNAQNFPSDSMATFDHLDREFNENQPDYLLTRFANSESVAFVESRGEIGGVVEKITAVVAPSTVLIEETITLQPPLSFQDAPLSYGHEAKPGGIFYTADLAADSQTHFRPIKDDASIIESINGNTDSVETFEKREKTPPLPVRNHINRFSINQQNQALDKNALEDKIKSEAPSLPPKPMPRKDIKIRKKRPPPPPPPITVPRRDVPLLSTVVVKIVDEGKDDACLEVKSPAAKDAPDNECTVPKKPEIQSVENHKEKKKNEEPNAEEKTQVEVIEKFEEESPVNKVLEIIEMKKIKTFNDSSPRKTSLESSEEHEKTEKDNFNDSTELENADSANNEKNLKNLSSQDTVSTEVEASEDELNIEELIEHLEYESLEKKLIQEEYINENMIDLGSELEEKVKEDEINEVNLDEIKDNVLKAEEMIAEDEESRIVDEHDEQDSTDESDDCEYYWQSTLATIGEEEETNSLEDTNANKEENDFELKPEIQVEDVQLSDEITKDSEQLIVQDETDCVRRITRDSEAEDKKQDKNLVNGRMDNCGDGQRLPPDGDEFPTSYQEFKTSSQYQFVTSRSTAVKSNDRLICNEEKTFLSNDGTKVHNEETFKNSILPVEHERLIEQCTVDVDTASKNLNSEKGKSYSTYQKKVSPEVMITKKKIEITNYYSKGLSSEVDPFSKNFVDSSPPPFPLSRPPKSDQSPIRKFSLNGDFRRQDDKSERSVRDKIAMFSSQGSLEGPLFPTSNGRDKMSKHKSSEDVFSEEKNVVTSHRTQSSYDLTTSAVNRNDLASKRNHRSPSLPSTLLPVAIESATYPTKIVSPNPPATLLSSQHISVSENKKIPVISIPKQHSNPSSYSGNGSWIKNHNATAKNSLYRATSFSTGSDFIHEKPQLSTEVLENSSVSRTNSLASTFSRRNSDNTRKNSLNQLIEQRRKSISKLRGLVIPEKETVPVDQPIIDLPEIKSRDSILNQVPKSNIQDKWGSQNSLASNTSTTSMPSRTTTTSFKMPAPQIMSKYSPAFKRKSLAVYSNATSVNSSTNDSTSPKSNQLTTTANRLIPDAPKSLESICSPTRSDYSFDFVSSSGSPDTLKSRPRINQKKGRADYDDSDNDSAVSSSQSSISRGFSPPMSPAPSERSTVSSERSYMSMETNYHRRSGPSDNIIRNQDPVITDRIPFKNNSLERSTSCIANTCPRPFASLFNETSKNSQICRRQDLKRSSSTDTSCSNSSTLTSGSQASAESLSRRVLKPQSVEAINRKNILASARCRSGKELNGSPLIQRKFSDDEELPVSNLVHENGEYLDSHRVLNGSRENLKKDIKVAYIEVVDDFSENEKLNRNEQPLLEKNNEFQSEMRSSKPQILEASNDLKMWVRAEAKTLVDSSSDKTNNVKESVKDLNDLPKRNSVSLALEEQTTSATLSSKSQIVPGENIVVNETKINTKSSIVTNKSFDDQNDLLTVLATKSRSRSAIHVDESSYGRSKSQMSLEDILAAKVEPKLQRAQSVSLDGKFEKNSSIPTMQSNRLSDPKDSRFARKSDYSSSSSWAENKFTFTSKIPAPSRPRITTDGLENCTETLDRSKTTSKIPTSRSLGRRSASVTDMKKALEKPEMTLFSGASSPGSQLHSGNHNRFPSLDSSVEENMRPVGTDDRYCGEQFGSISSLASSTSLISQQELAQLVEEASLEEARGAHDVIVVLLHKENPHGSVGITLAGGVDCEAKEITVHRVLTHSIADKDGRVQRGDRILSINGRSTRGLTHHESLAVLKQPRPEVVLVVSRVRYEEGSRLRSRTDSVETIIEGRARGLETNGGVENTAWGPPSTIAVYKDGAGLGFSLEGGRDSPLGDRPLIIKKIFTGGAAEKSGALKAGDQLLEVNGNDVTRMSRIETWSLMKKLHDGEVNLLVRHLATKSS